MTTAADILREWFGRKTCQQTMAQCHAPHRIAKLDLIIGCTQREGMTDRDFLLSRAVLVNGLLYKQFLFAERPYNIVHDLCRKIQSNRAVDWRLVERNIST